MYDVAIITKHAEKRLKERTGLKKRNFDKYTQEAFEIGIKHTDTKGNLRKYIDYLSKKNQIGENIRIHNRIVWIFCGNILITVFSLYNKFHRTEDILKSKQKA